MLHVLTALSPNAAILILTLGLALIALELNRPGSILPGATGLLLALLSAASLMARHPSTADALLFVSFVGMSMLPTRNKRLTWLVVAVTTIGLILSMVDLLPRTPGPAISPWIAAFSGITLAVGTTALTRIAFRARQNKGLD